MRKSSRLSMIVGILTIMSVLISGTVCAAPAPKA